MRHEKSARELNRILVSDYYLCSNTLERFRREDVLSSRPATLYAYATALVKYLERKRREHNELAETDRMRAIDRAYRMAILAFTK